MEMAGNYWQEKELEHAEDPECIIDRPTSETLPVSQNNKDKEDEFCRSVINKLESLWNPYESKCWCCVHKKVVKKDKLRNNLRFLPKALIPKALPRPLPIFLHNSAVAIRMEKEKCAARIYSKAKRDQCRDEEKQDERSGPARERLRREMEAQKITHCDGYEQSGWMNLRLMLGGWIASTGLDCNYKPNNLPANSTSAYCYRKSVQAECWYSDPKPEKILTSNGNCESTPERAPISERIAEKGQPDNNYM
uniref:Uncharacterized protein n=1 Tax=Ditylenchus dipsaci TaxID=166011 RepID=A0A915D0Y8_9BILA